MMKPSLLVLVLPAALLVGGCLKRVGEPPAAEPDRWPPVTLAAGEKLVEVDAEAEPCPDGSDRRCLRIRFRPDQPWGLLRGKIDDLAWTPGYVWLIKVGPPLQRQQGLEHHWRLLEVVDKTIPGLDLPAGLRGTRWLLTELVADGQAVNVAGGAGLEWADVDRLVGTTGCNRFHAGVRSAGAGLSVGVGRIPTTRRACPGPAMAQEQAFLGALERTDVISREEPALVFASRDGAWGLRFRPAP